MSERRIIEVERCPLNRGVFAEIDGRELAIFRRSDGGVTVMDNSCPHASGNLSGGEVRGRTVSCPWHQWTFDLDTGICTHSPLARATVYPSRIIDGVIYADLNPPAANTPPPAHTDLKAEVRTQNAE